MYKRCVVSSFVLISLATVALAQKAGTAPGDKFLGRFRPLSSASPAPIPDPSIDYGLAPGQGIASSEVKLVMKRDGAPATPNDVFRGVGRVIAIARTGPTGGVTFPNVPPGTYLVIFQVVEWVTPVPNRQDRHGPL